MTIDHSAFPRVDSFSAAPAAKSAEQHPQSLQVAAGSKVVLRWQASGAEAVELTDPAAKKPLRFGAATRSTTVTAHAATQDYSLVAIAGASRSPPVVVHVSTHSEDEFISAHGHADTPTRQFKLMLQNDEGVARAGLRFTITAGAASIDGVTGPEGALEAALPADATEGELVLHSGAGDEKYTVVFGGTVPPDHDDD